MSDEDKEVLRHEIARINSEDDANGRVRRKISGYTATRFFIFDNRTQTVEKAIKIEGHEDKIKKLEEAYSEDRNKVGGAFESNSQQKRYGQNGHDSNRPDDRVGGGVGGNASLDGFEPASNSGGYSGQGDRTQPGYGRGRLSTDNGAFSLPNKDTRYCTDISFSNVTPVEETRYANLMYYKPE